MFIKLTPLGGQEQYVNINHIIRYCEDGCNYTEIFISDFRNNRDDMSIVVNMHVSEFKAMIDKELMKTKAQRMVECL